MKKYKKGNVLKEMFGVLKGRNKKSAHQMVKEARKELESKWMRKDSKLLKGVEYKKK